MGQPTERYPIPSSHHRVEEDISRSRFITTITPAATVAEAQTFIQSIRDEFPDANHHCWAFLIGPPGSSARVGLSDDGEPHGTAGKPMLQVLNHCGIGDLAVVVTRYFGGTKLGKGGLVRAYGGGVKLCLSSLPTKEKVFFKPLRFCIDYGDVNLVKRLFESYQCENIVETYEARVTIDLDIAQDQRARFESVLVDQTQGRASLIPIDKPLID